MSEKDKELIDKVSRLPDELKEKLIQRAEGAAEAIKIMREERERQ